MEKLILFLKKWTPRVLLFIGVLLIAYIAGRCSTKAERDQSLSNLIASRDSVKQSKVVINDLENTVYEQGAIILTKDKAIEAGILEQERLRKLHIKDLLTNTDLLGVIHRQDSLLKLPPETIFITIKDTSGVARDYVRIPFQLLKKADKYLALNAGMKEGRTAWYDLSVPFSGTVSVGYVGSGFLNLKKTPKGIFTTENPYIKINQMDVLIIQDNKTLFQKTWFHLVLGAGIMEGVNYILKK
jgi:hypothetical protein